MELSWYALLVGRVDKRFSRRRNREARTSALKAYIEFRHIVLNW